MLPYNRVTLLKRTKFEYKTKKSPPLTAAELLARRLSSPEVSGGTSNAQQPPCPPFMLANQHVNGNIDQNNDLSSQNGNDKAGQGGVGSTASPFTKFVQGNIFKNFFK